MTPIRHNYKTFESSDGYDVIEEWLKDNDISYGEYSRGVQLSAKLISVLNLTGGRAFIKGFDIPNPEDFVATKLRWE